jgi:hypothetical protein
VLILHTGGTLGMDVGASFEASPQEEPHHPPVLKKGTGGTYPPGLEPGAMLSDLFAQVPELCTYADLDLQVCGVVVWVGGVCTQTLSTLSVWHRPADTKDLLLLLRAATHTRSPLKQHQQVLFNKDSSRVGPKEWVHIAKVLHQNRCAYDAFLVVHGTDTLAYTAAALSLMLAGECERVQHMQTLPRVARHADKTRTLPHCPPTC